MQRVRLEPVHASRGAHAVRRRRVADLILVTILSLAVLTLAAGAPQAQTPSKGRSNYQDGAAPTMQVTPPTRPPGGAAPAPLAPLAATGGSVSPPTPTPEPVDLGEVGGALSLAGVELSPLRVAASDAKVIRTVGIYDDRPISTHVLQSVSGLPIKQRTEAGQWVDWDGNPDSLIDNRFTPVDGWLTFRVLRADLTASPFPVNFIIAYKTEAGLKFGVFNIVPQ